MGILPFCGSLPKSQFSIRFLSHGKGWGNALSETMLPSAGHVKSTENTKTCDFGARERPNQKAAGGAQLLSHS